MTSLISRGRQIRASATLQQGLGELRAEMQGAHGNLAEEILKSNQVLRAALIQAQEDIDAEIRHIMLKIGTLIGRASFVCIICIKYSPCTTNIR